MTKKIKNLNYYLNLPWQYEFTKHPDGKYSARVIGLSCYSGGDTLEEATKEIQEALNFYLESCIEDGLSIPEPQTIANANGRLSIRTSKALHLKFLKLASEERRKCFCISSC